MAKGAEYIIIGKGRWGTRMHALLVGEGRRVKFAPSSRREVGESDADYEARVSRGFAVSAAPIAWLCVPPGAYVPLLMRAALNAGLHVIVEKPWNYSGEETAALQRVADTTKLKIGVHFEYCFLSGMQSWRREYSQQSGSRFRGFLPPARATTWESRRCRIWARIFSPYTNTRCRMPQLRKFVAVLLCESADGVARIGQRRIDEIDLLAHQEPIIQRYLTSFESSLDGDAFPDRFGICAAGERKT